MPTALRLRRAGIMSYPAESVGLVGQVMVWAGCVASALTAAGEYLSRSFEGRGFVAFQPPDGAASNALWLGLAGIATIVVNGVVAIFKDRHARAGETAVAIAESEARTEARVAQALRAKDGEMAVLYAQLDKATHKRHDLRDELQVITIRNAVEKQEMAAKIALLESRLGMTGATHAVAINATAENVEALADKTHTVLPAPISHVDPVSGSDDELLPGFPPHQPPR